MINNFIDENIEIIYEKIEDLSSKKASELIKTRKVKGEYNMTGRRNEIFNKLVEFIKIKGYTPTIREFGKYIGLNSPATVQWYLKSFEKDGLIKRINNRSIKILGNTNE